MSTCTEPNSLSRTGSTRRCARAEQEGRSISELVREVLRTALARPPELNSRLPEIEGVGEDASTYGEDHDRFLYGDRDGG